MERYIRNNSKRKKRKKKRKKKEKKNSSSFSTHTRQEDISNIEAGLIPLPEYPADTLAHHIATSAPHSHHQHPVFGTPVTAGPTPPPRPTASAGGGGAAASAGVPSSAGAGGHTTAAAPASGVEPRKGVPWSEEEHRLFLLGLAKFGKGDWRSISRHFVVSRTPTQVASHAQKYFIRLTNASKKEKRRSSIHDMTSPGGSGGSGDAPVGDGRMPPDVQRAMQADLAAAGVSAPAAAAAALAAAQGMPLAAATVAGYAG